MQMFKCFVMFAWTVEWIRLHSSGDANKSSASVWRQYQYKRLQCVHNSHVGPCSAECLYPDSASLVFPLKHVVIFIHLFIQAISIALLQVLCYSEALPTQHRYCVGVSRRSATGNCE